MSCPECRGTGQVPDPRAIGTAMRAKRKATGLSLSEVARRLDVSAAYVSDLELGHRAWGDAITARYCAALKRKRTAT